MRYTPKPFFAVFAALLLITACKKPNYDGGNLTIITANSAELLEALQTAPTSFSVTAGIPQEIVGPKGTFMRFYPNSFRDNNGNIINSGTVNIELTEMYTAGDMIKYHTSTNTSSSVLTSGGEVFIKATMGGQEVTANKYGLGFSASGASATGARALYFGNTYATDHIVTWGPGDGSTGTVVTGPASVSTTTVTLTSSSYYMFDTCKSFNWVGCHNTYSGSGQNITVKVKLANVSFAGNVWSIACMGLSSQTVATTLYQESFDRATQTGTYKGWAPMGVAQKFMVIIPYDRSNWYYYKTEQIVTDGMTINATMTKADKTEMGAALTAF